MKYIKTNEGFKIWINKLQIQKKCMDLDINNYTINPDGSIDVDGSVQIKKMLSKLPLKFNKINRDFYCRDNNLKTFEGSPVEVGGFSCYNNELTSFKGSPKIIRGGFDCDDNNIKSFEHFPSYVGLRFYCNNNPIWEVWDLFRDTTKIELLNDCDIFRDEDKYTPGIVMCVLNDFLTMIGEPEVKSVEGYKNI